MDRICLLYDGHLGERRTSMEYTKPIYDEVDVPEVPEPQPRSIVVVVVLAGIIGGGVSGCSKKK